MKKILFDFLSFLNSVIPKRKIILFNSFPDLSGNSLALYEYILKNRQDITEEYQLVWCISSDKNNCLDILKYRTGEPYHCLVQKKSPKGIFYYLIAKYIISTHGYFPLLKTSKQQTHLNLWHGMPFKRIGRMLEKVHTNGKSDEADITIATSSIFQDIMAKSFGLEKSMVLVTGQPCNDLLFEKKDVLNKFGIDKTKFRKILVWMPTYRKSVVGDIRQDGTVDSFGVYAVLSGHFDDLNKLLESENSLLIIKPHPMDAINEMKFTESEHIIILKNDDLSQKYVQLYELLSECDVLITDYSSVFIDFLVTGKPIAFICDDLREYGASRGFCFDSPQDYMTGEIIQNYQALADYIINMDQINEKWKQKYVKVQKDFNIYCDNHSSQRICNIMFGSTH